LFCPVSVVASTLGIESTVIKVLVSGDMIVANDITVTIHAVGILASWSSSSSSTAASSSKKRASERGREQPPHKRIPRPARYRVLSRRTSYSDIKKPSRASEVHDYVIKAIATVTWASEFA
jgi:hypothetical protein